MDFLDYSNLIPSINVLRNVPSFAVHRKHAQVKSLEPYSVNEVIVPTPYALFCGDDHTASVMRYWLTPELFDLHCLPYVGRAEVMDHLAGGPLPSEKTFKAITTANVFDKRNTTIALLFEAWGYADSLYYREWQYPQLKDIGRARVIEGGITLVGTATTIFYSRLNSNIYKNIFPHNVIDITYIHDKIDMVLTSANQVQQEAHGFKVNDVVFLDDDGVYRLSQADKPETAKVSGMVTKVNTAHIFTLLSIGRIKWQREPFVDTTILYLSDTEPGKLVHHTAIKSKILVPVAIYLNSNIILNIQQGSIGLDPYPYKKQLEVENFERYTIYEINEIIQAVDWGVSDA